MASQPKILMNRKYIIVTAAKKYKLNEFIFQEIWKNEGTIWYKYYGRCPDF